MCEHISITSSSLFSTQTTETENFSFIILILKEIYGKTRVFSTVPCAAHCKHSSLVTRNFTGDWILIQQLFLNKWSRLDFKKLYHLTIWFSVATALWIIKMASTDLQSTEYITLNTFFGWYNAQYNSKK